MARQRPLTEPADYYPPRARWYSPVLSLGESLRRQMALDRLALPREMTPGGLVAAFLIPGLGVRLRGFRVWGNLALVVSFGLLLFFLIRLGYPSANVAFGLLASLHATGFMFYCRPLLAQESFRFRLIFTLLALLGMSFLLYAPARNWVQKGFAPLRLNGRVVVVQRMFQSPPVRRGDTVAYALMESENGNAHRGGAVRIQSGMGFGPVLAVAGDEVRFYPHAYSVNDVTFTNLPHMPTNGNFVVPEKHWFIWPSLAISGHGNVSEAGISAAMLQLANVREEQYFGRALKHWFGRRQILP